nr:PREDICTED: SPARC-related modular calcium-binding protein 2 [Apteryx mantelli mantelli]
MARQSALSEAGADSEGGASPVTLNGNDLNYFCRPVARSPSPGGAEIELLAWGTGWCRGQRCWDLRSRGRVGVTCVGGGCELPCAGQSRFQPAETSYLKKQSEVCVLTGDKLSEILRGVTVLPALCRLCQFLRVDQDKDRECSLDCAGSPQKSLCASDGRTFLSRCEFQRAKCKDPQLEIAYRGNCKDVSRCVAERKYTQEQARKEFQQVFIPECNDDGTYSQVQCHSYTGYCWCVTPNGRPISGTAVAHKTPRCPGSVSEKLPQREGAGKTDDASAPALETQPQGDEEDIASRYPTLWTEQVKSRQNKTNKSSASSCDQELQSALEEAKQPQKDNVFIPECAQGGLYKPVQCHPSTGYCWCVLVDTGRPIPGTSTRYEQPKCDNSARAHPTKTKDLYKGRQLQGCPGAKKNEFLTSVLDALSTDMVHAVSDPSLSSSRVSEPDPNHTLEERVVHWYFKQLDKNSNGDIGKKEIKPFKRFLRKKSKPKKCVKKFVEYCDVNNDKSLSVQELMGCLGVTKEEGKAETKKRHTAPKTNTESTSSSRQQVSKKQG